MKLSRSTYLLGKSRKKGLPIMEMNLQFFCVYLHSNNEHWFFYSAYLFTLPTFNNSSSFYLLGNIWHFTLNLYTCSDIKSRKILSFFTNIYIMLLLYSGSRKDVAKIYNRLEPEGKPHMRKINIFLNGVFQITDTKE